MTTLFSLTRAASVCIPVLIIFSSCTASPPVPQNTQQVSSLSPTLVPSSKRASKPLFKPSPKPSPTLPKPLPKPQSKPLLKPSPKPAPPSHTPIRESVTGSCKCPYDVDRAGRSCGGRSAYSRPGGEAPICYQDD